MVKTMSNTTNLQRKQGSQGTTLTLEQYQLLYAFIRHGVTPTRKSINNAGIPGTAGCSHSRGSGLANALPIRSLKRFKTIASRLEYRDSDDEIIFKLGSGIVIPNTRFNEVIAEAHRNDGGHKHRTIKCTLETLSEKYALGSRQYGICEESVRSVIRMCNQGSCATKKKIPGLNVFKNFVCNTSRTPQNLSNDLKMKRRRRSCLRRNENKQQTKQVEEKGQPNDTSVAMEHQDRKCETWASQNGNTSSNDKTPFVQIIPIAPSMLNIQNATNPYTVPNGVSWFPTVNQHMAAYLGNQFGNCIQQIPTMHNLASNKIPLQIVQAGSKPVRPGQQIVLVNTSGRPVTHSQFKTMMGIHALNSTEPSAIDLSLNNQPTRNKALVINDESEGNMDESGGNIDQRPLKMDNSNNEAMNNVEPSLQDVDILDLSHTTSPLDNSPILGLADSMDEGSMQAHLNQVIADANPRGMDADDNVHEHDHQLKEWISDEETDSPDDGYVPMMPPIPYKEMWNYYNGIAAETNPYNRIARCISDMSLDLRKACVGCWMSGNKLKRKINYIQELISGQQEVTRQFAELTQWH